MKHEKEYMDVLSLDGEPTGKSVLREVIYEEQLPHFIAHVMIVTPSGDFIFQRRSQSKLYMPGRLVSAGSGHVRTGESLTQASQRELSEEAGTKLGELFSSEFASTDGDSKIGFLKYQDPERHDFVKFLAVSELVSSEMPEVQDEVDVKGFEKYSRADIEALQDAQQEFHPETYFILKEKYGLNI